MVSACLVFAQTIGCESAHEYFPIAAPELGRIALEHDPRFRDENGEKHSVGDRSRAEIRAYCYGCTSLEEVANLSSLKALEASSAASGLPPTIPTDFHYELGIVKKSADASKITIYAINAAVLGSLAAGIITCFGTDACNQTGKTAVFAITLGVPAAELLYLLLSEARFH